MYKKWTIFLLLIISIRLACIQLTVSKKGNYVKAPKKLGNKRNSQKIHKDNHSDNARRIKSKPSSEHQAFTSHKANNATKKLNSTFKNETHDHVDSLCGCRRIVSLNTSSAPDLSTCDVIASARGPDQRVISFVLYGKGIREKKVIQPQYLSGISQNAALVRSLYPGFSMRLYTDWPARDATGAALELCPIYCNERDFGHLDICNSHQLPILGNISWSFSMLWRLSPMCDPLVSEWHSRDLDSRITQREVSAVDDWRSNTTAWAHSMKDHPLHQGHHQRIMGGLFGMRMSAENRARACATFRTIIAQSLNETIRSNVDQRLLAKHFCPWARSHTVFHDSYSCREQNSCRSESVAPHSGVRPFPTQRLPRSNTSKPTRNHFVGAYADRPLEVHTPCPAACRPKEHQDWIYC